MRILLVLVIILACAACAASAPSVQCPTAPAPNAPRQSQVAAPQLPAIDAAAIETMSATRRYTLGTPKPVKLLPDGDVLFLRTPPRSLNAELFELDAATGAIQKLASASDLLTGDVKLSAAEKALRERSRIALRGIVHVDASEDGARLLLPLGEQVFVFERATRKAHPIALGSGYPDVPSISPDGKRIAFVRDQDLWVADIDGRQPRRLTRHETPAISNGSAEFIAQEELDRPSGYWWSPDSAFLMYQRTDETAVETLYVSNPVDPSEPPTPFRYPRAGTPNAEIKLAIIPVSGGKPVWIDWDHQAMPYVRHAQWPKDAPPTLVVMNRAQTEARVLTADPKTGKTRTLLVETDAAWVNVPDGPRWFAKGSRFAWSKEKDDAWQLELRARDGKLEDTFTFAGFDGGAQIDDETGEIWVTGSRNPTETHVGRANLATHQIEQLTSRPGVHDVTVAKRGGARVLVENGADGKRSWKALRRDGTLIAELPSVAEDAPALPNARIETVDIDGRTHYASIVRPRDFDPARKYPVILQVYAGPGVNTVWNLPRAYFRDQLFADTGFIVVRADGRGTPRRGRAWERVISRDLITVALADQVALLAALGKAHRELDLQRVGIVGWSFGGYVAAMGALLRPDVFHAAIAGAPVTDWRYYDTAYTERYMGLPAERVAAYDATSAVKHAAKLERPLLLVHGLTDDNVYVANTLALADALLRAKKDFDLVMLGSTHMVVDPIAETALMTKQIEFFRTHLGQAQRAQDVQ